MERAPEYQQVVADALAYLARVRAGLPVLAGALRRAEYRAALEQLRDALEGLQWVTRLAQALGLEEDPQVPVYQAGCAALLEALEDGDYVLVADLLEAEFGDAVAALADLLTPAAGPAH